MSRPTAALLLCFAFLAACRQDVHNKEKVEQAILDRLRNHSGLDLQTLDVATTNVNFDKNLAYATVSFHPKGDPRLASEMVMKYTLEDNDGKWVVVTVGDGQGHAMSQGDGMAGSQGHDPGTQLPPGHPQIGDAPQPNVGGKE